MANKKIVWETLPEGVCCTDEENSDDDTKYLSANDQVKIIHARSNTVVARIDAETRKASVKYAAQVAETRATMCAVVIVCALALALIQQVIIIIHIFVKD